MTSTIVVWVSITLGIFSLVTLFCAFIARMRDCAGDFSSNEEKRKNRDKASSVIATISTSIWLAIMLAVGFWGDLLRLLDEAEPTRHLEWAPVMRLFIIAFASLVVWAICALLTRSALSVGKSDITPQKSITSAKTNKVHKARG